jgi:transcription termination/antitermination protein NusA
MSNSIHIGNTEILQIADAVAREKGIQKDSVIEAMEQAIQVAGRRKYGHDHNIRAEIDRKSGEIKLFRERDVVNPVEDTATQISLPDALTIDPNVKLGGIISEPLPPIDLGRVAAQTAKQVLVQKVRDAERDRQYEDFKDRIGEIVNGTIKKIEYGNVTVDLGRTEAVLRRDAIIRNEMLRLNDRVRAYVEDVRRETKGAQIFLSRTHPMFLAKLFAQEVPEVYDGVIEIKSVSREPGSRAKMAVISHDHNIDPVGACVGVRGARVQAVIAELQGEKIDIITWSADPATFVVNALAPAEITKVVIDEDKHRIEVVVAEDQLSLAIGRRGQNVRLASQLTGWNIDVLTEDVESKRRVDEFNSLSNLFVEALDVEDVLAQLLASEGFTSLEEIAYVPLEELASIEGFDADIAEELRQRALNYLENKNTAADAKWHELGMDENIAHLPHVTGEIMVKLGEGGVKTLNDLGDLSRDEFIEIVPASGLSDSDIDEMIMAARSNWFDADKEENV